MRVTEQLEIQSRNLQSSQNIPILLIFLCREYIVYLVPILMLLFIGSLVVMLICLRVRGCEFDFLLPFANRNQASSDSANGFVSTTRNPIQMNEGEMVIMTDIIDVLPHNGNNNSRLRSGNNHV